MLTVSQQQEGQYSHLVQQSAYGPEAAVAWGEKQLSVVGKRKI